MKERTIRICTGQANYPEIRLRGKWLLDQGYQSGDYIRIAYDPEQILIKKIGGCNGSDTQER